MNTPCEEWGKYRDKNGYGQVRFDGRATYAHRAAYCELRGMGIHEIDGLVVLHKCDNPSCVNPEHLELGTHADNVADKVQKNRQQCGEDVPGAKLTEGDVRNIRASYQHGVRGKGYASLAKQYGVTLSAIVSVIKRKTWNHVEGKP